MQNSQRHIVGLEYGAAAFPDITDYKGSITVKIDAIAASAASVVAMAGDTVQMSPVAMLMIHDPSTVAMGNTKDMEKQVLSCPYPYDKARIIVMEMADSLVLQLTDKGLVTDSLTLDVGYDRENCDSGKYRGPVHIDHYGRTVPKGAHGTVKLDNPTNLGSILISATTELFERIADKTLTVRRITIAANRVVKDEGFFQVDLFTDTTKLEKEKKLQNAMLGLKKKFGKNAVLKGTNYLDGATMRERNQQIGGHKAK